MQLRPTRAPVSKSKKANSAAPGHDTLGPADSFQAQIFRDPQLPVQHRRPWWALRPICALRRKQRHRHSPDQTQHLQGIVLSLELLEVLHKNPPIIPTPCMPRLTFAIDAPRDPCGQQLNTGNTITPDWKVIAPI